jgi:hypothetical protein
MFDSDLIDDLPAIQRDEAKAALSMLVASGLIDAQRKRLIEQLAVGDATEPLPLVAQRVLDYRKHDQALQGLEELGNQYLMEETDNA